MNLQRYILALFALYLSQASFAATKISPQGLWTYNDSIGIPTLVDPADTGSEAIELPANIYIPNSDDPAATFPAVIFISSWFLNEYEYAQQAELLANNGYVVLSYTARGFRGAPGQISTAGNEDRADVAAAIDYLLDSNNRIPANPNAIGLSGISYGAGISLLAAMTDERVKAVAVMSGWGDLVESLWVGNTPNYAWLEILIGTAQPIPFIINNDPSPEIEANYNNMKIHQGVEDTKVWGAVRSPISYIDNVNQRTEKPAIFISNNMHDYLFQPDSLVRLLKHYEGEWRLDLNRGTHGTAEAAGLLGDEDHEIWANLALWFDHYLKGVDNGINERKPFSTKVLNTMNRESYDSLQPEDETLVFNLIPESGLNGGQLVADTANDVDLDITFQTLDHMTYSGWVTGALQHTGRTLDTNTVDTTMGLMFVSAVLDTTLRLRGEAKVTINILAQDKAQYFGYLFFLDPATGIANWVSHAPFSCHQSEGCGLNPDQPEQIVLDFYWTAVDIPAGKQLLLIVDGNDPDYWRYDDTPTLNTVAFSAAQQSTLRLPIVWESPRYDTPIRDTDTSDTSRSSNGEGAGTSGSGLGGSITHRLLFLLLFSAFARLYRRV
jgi:acetyl esterase/lipase